jgi:hypothetical protein
MDSKIKSALDAAGTAADYSARATYQRGYDAGVASVEAREWALGVQVVAQAARLKLADELAVALRSISPMLPRSLTTSAHGDPVWTTAIRKVESALAAWGAVPGMEP